MAPPERPVPFLTPPAESLRSGFESADAAVADEVVLRKRGLWELRLVSCGVVVPGVNMLVVVAGGNDDDEVSERLITVGSEEGGTRLDDDWEMVENPNTGETCTTVVMVGSPCIIEGDTSVGTAGGRMSGASSSSSS
jgi:hypothetical protein